MIEYLLVYVLGLLTIPLIRHRKQIMKLIRREVEDAKT